MGMAQLKDGDIIVVQRVLTEDEERRVRFPSAPELFEYVLQVRQGHTALTHCLSSSSLTPSIQDRNFSVGWAGQTTALACGFR
jgi:hypothetical protein